MHVGNEASQRPQCLFCRAVLDPRRSGRRQRFCPGGKCRRLFWQEARRIGGKNLRRRLAQARKPRTPGPKRAILRLPLAQYEDLRAFIAASAAWW